MTIPVSIRAEARMPSRIFAVGVVAAAVLGAGADVAAQPAVGARPINAAPAQNVRVQGGKSLPIGKLADLAFADARAKVTPIASGKGLLAPPTIVERFSETNDVTVLEHVVSFTVTDPAAFRSAGGRYATYHAGITNRGNVSVATLKPEAKKGFDEYKASLASKPANHPLKQAMARGDDALLDAIAEGKGDVTITTKVTVEKADRALTGRTAQFPSDGAAGLDFGKKITRSYRIVPPSNGATGKTGAAFVLESTNTSGSATDEARFLTGFTKAKVLKWEERWDLGKKDYFSIGLYADYAFGLRIPFKVKGLLSPSKMSTRIKDTEQTYSVRISADTLDADEKYYLDAGLSNVEAADGKELVLEAHAHAQIDVEAGWGTVSVHKRVPENLGFDWGKNFKPPFGDCGTKCGFDAWIPADITKTKLSVLGIVEGKAQIGFNVSGNGTVEFDYGALWDEGFLTSSYAGQTSRAHHFSFTSPNSGKLLTTTLPISRSGGTRAYGWKVSDPRYTWDVKVTPGVKGNVSVNAKPFFSLDEEIGPFWIDALAFELGSLKFSAHEGTNTAIEAKSGKKTFTALP